MLHIYCGDGKGKTTAAVGLAARFAGAGGKVLFCQFMKSGNSSELDVLSSIANIVVFPCFRIRKFVYEMNDFEKENAHKEYTADFGKIKQFLADDKTFGMVVFDEIISCVNTGLIDINSLCDFLRENQEIEIVLTGREPDKRLCDAADYISEIRCKKHPYDKNIPARKGIEF